MLKPIRLTRLSSQVQIADAQGRPTPVFMRYFNDTLDRIEGAVNGVIDAQLAADQAQEAANMAQATGEAAQIAADEKITKAEADGLYVQQDMTPTWQPGAGAADRGAFTVYAAPTISDPPTAAEVQALANAEQASQRHLKALLDDLIANSTVTG